LSALRRSSPRRTCAAKRRFAFIQVESAFYPVKLLCKVLKVSRSGFYASVTRAQSAHTKDDRRLRVLCSEAHERSRRNYGSVRVHRVLQKQGVLVSSKRVCRLMRLEGIAGKRRRRWTRTTESVVGLPTALNLLSRDFSPAKPNQSWAADVTFFRTPHGFVYLAVIIDLFSRYVIGWSVSAVNDANLVHGALQAALQRRGPPPGLLHHSDQGSTYTSETYQHLMKENGIVCSMSRRGNCDDNAVVESFFGTFKTELAEDFESAHDVKRQAFSTIEIFYNQQRMHSALGYQSPAEYERAARMSRVA
jgi:putative transposase